MAKAAELRAGNFVLASLSRLEPYRNIAARYCILLKPHVRNEEAMDYILGRQLNADHLVDRHVHVVLARNVIRGAQLAVRPGVRDFPVKLLRRNSVEDVAWRSVLLDVGPGRSTQDREQHEDRSGSSRPKHLERWTAIDVGCLSALFVSVE